MSTISPPSDQELFFLLKQGDKCAFANIYERYKYILHAHALNKIRDREEALDVVQEVFTYLWDKREVIQFNGNLSGYLYTAVRNAILNKITRNQVRNKYFDSIRSFCIEDQVETDYLIRERQLIELIESEIALLPPRMREIFVLSRKENLSHKEIAEQLGLSEQTVSKQISNALKILKSKLDVLFILCLWLYR